MQVHPGVGLQPGLDHGVLVGAVVVADQVDLEALGHGLVDLGLGIKVDDRRRADRCRR